MATTRRMIGLGAFAGVAAIAMTQLGAQPRTREDCVPYNRSTLRLTDEGERGWLISRDDGARFMAFDTKEDADKVLAVFQAHSAFCYVGRDNKRPDRSTFVHEYWK